MRRQPRSLHGLVTTLRGLAAAAGAAEAAGCTGAGQGLLAAPIAMHRHRRYGAVPSSASNVLPPGLDPMSKDGQQNLAAMSLLVERMQRELARVRGVLA